MDLKKVTERMETLSNFVTGHVICGRIWERIAESPDKEFAGVSLWMASEYLERAAQVIPMIVETLEISIPVLVETIDQHEPSEWSR